MTASSIWGQAAPSPAPTYGNPGATSTYGTIFQLSQSAALTGIWYYSAPSDAVLPAKCGIWNMSSGTLVAGTENTAPSWSGALGSGWVKCAYDGSVTLAASTQYATAVYWTSTVNKGFQTSVAYPITSGIITAPASDTAGLKNAPFQTEFWTVPATDGGGGFNWFVDVEVTPPSSPFSAVFQSTSGGVQTWTVTSVYNGPGTSTLRIVPPVSPAGRAHSFLVMLPVEPGTGSTFGDPVAVAQALGAPDAYNTTVAVPSFPISPWYADNPLNSAQRQESFVLALASWLLTSGFASGGEKVYLIGFSKSGLGSQALQFRNPSAFAATASWDAPFMATALNTGADTLTDPTFGSGVGGGPAEVYGTDANFQAYRLSSSNLATWKAASNFGAVTRLWAGGQFTFGADVTAYKAALTSAGILFDGSWNTADVAHAWENDWVAAGLASIMSMPQASAAAALTGTGTLTAAVSVPAFAGSAALSGRGTLTAGALLALRAAASLAGSGSLHAAAQVVTPGAEPSVAWSAVPSAPRWTCAPRGTAALPVFPPIAALSLEYVNVLWNSDLDGTSVDPTGQTQDQPQLPVQFAFPQTSGDYTRPAEPVTWLTGSWLLGGTGRGFVAQALIGPGGGVVTLTAGLMYDAWCRVNGSPESPAKFVGTLQAY